MKRALLLISLAVAACSPGPYEKAQARVEFLEENGASADELCEARQAVAEAAIEEGRDEDYRLASAEAGIECQGARLGV